MQVDWLQAIKKLMTTMNIQTLQTAAPFTELKRFDYGLRNALDPVFDWEDFGNLLLQEVQPNTLLLAEDNFDLHYAMFLPPDNTDSLVVIGPWRTSERSDPQMEYLTLLLGEEAAKAVQEYYNGVLLVEEAPLVSGLLALVSMGYPPQRLRCIHRKEFLPLNFQALEQRFREPVFQQDIPIFMLEQRYEAENAILDAVSRGDVDAAFMTCRRYQRFRITDRFSTILRNRKNMLIIFNTLLRKAIERSYVHPYYIDKISTKYSFRIENMSSESEQHQIFTEMLREYCLYVQRYALKDYSPLIQKVINHINLNLDSALSLKSLATLCFISPSYLSNLFKQETGVTLTDYINTQRIQRAAMRLRTSNHSVAAIAAEVGMMDVNYFTKIFKRTMGTTPSQYRREHKEY